MDAQIRPRRQTAREFAELVLDDGSFSPFAAHTTPDPDEGYRRELQAATERSGEAEAVLAGTGLLQGQPVVLMAGEFGFLGGSLGRAGGDALLEAVEHATAHGLPLLAAPCSGGTRMQEGTPALVQMVKVAQAVNDHRRAGLPYLVHMRHPTTGGVLASFASLGQWTSAEPGALVGFLGPRVQEVVNGERLPEGVQRAENLHRVGVIDAVLPNELVRETWHRLLRTWSGGDAPDAVPDEHVVEAAARIDAWDAVLASRHPGRPGALDLLATCGQDTVWLSGTGDGQVDPSTRVGLVRLSGQPCVVVAHDRETDGRHPLGPAALRIAQRGFRLAAELGLPVVTLVDTPGADVSVAAEEHALCGEIARCTAALADLPVPTVSVVLGRGTGGATLALLPADRTLCAANGWVAPLPPEGASAIIHRTDERAADMARLHRIGAHDLVDAGIADEVVAEPEVLDEAGARLFCERMGQAIARHLHELRAQDRDERLRQRRTRLRSFG